MDRPWRLKEIDEAATARLAREIGLHAATARCLVGRGIVDASGANAFLRPRLADLRPPDRIAGFLPAVERLSQAVRAGERIGVFGDYDVDGVTTTALLTIFLRGVGATVAPRVARRDAGYGFGEVDAAWFAGQACGLVVTCDCGTSDLPAILAARAQGMDVIVLDHHQVPDGPDHPSFALLNPHRADSEYPFRGLASVGLGFMLAARLKTALKEGGWFDTRPEPDVRELLDLVAIGTIADMAPLREENRVLVSAGLKMLTRRHRPGLAALLERAEVERHRALDETDISWKLGPRLNAPGRLGDATPALELLLAADAREAAQHAAACDDANMRRRALTDRVVQEALEDAVPHADEAAIVVAREGWHAGVVGIVAAKLVERYARPAAVIALDPATGEGRGSVRSAGGVDVVRALARCRDQLVRYGGHAAAAGLTVAAPRVEELRREFARAVADAASAVADAARGLDVDAELELGQIDDRLADEFHQLAPYGPGNERPVMAARGARVRSSRRVGDGSHLKLLLECTRTSTAHPAIAFRLADRDPGVGATVDVAFCPEVSQWRGECRVELKVHDLRRTGT